MNVEAITHAEQGVSSLCTCSTRMSFALYQVFLYRPSSYLSRCCVAIFLSPQPARPAYVLSRFSHASSAARQLPLVSSQLRSGVTSVRLQTDTRRFSAGKGCSSGRPRLAPPPFLSPYDQPSRQATVLYTDEYRTPPSFFERLSPKSIVCRCGFPNLRVFKVLLRTPPAVLHPLGTLCGRHSTPAGKIGHPACQWVVWWGTA